jgi:hypothetical protein
MLGLERRTATGFMIRSKYRALSTTTSRLLLHRPAGRCRIIEVKRTSQLRVPKSENDPGCVKTFFRSQKLHATGDDPRRHDGLSVFLLYRAWSQPGRNLGPR